MVAKNAALNMLRLPEKQLAQVRTSAAEPTARHGLEHPRAYGNTCAAHPWGTLPAPNQRVLKLFGCSGELQVCFGCHQRSVTESQNHRMFGVGRALCGSSSPTLLPKQGHLQQAAQHRVQAGLEYLQRRRLHNLPGQPVPVLRHPQREEVLPSVQTELLMLQFVPIAPCPVAGHH